MRLKNARGWLAVIASCCVIAVLAWLLRDGGRSEPSAASSSGTAGTSSVPGAVASVGVTSQNVVATNQSLVASPNSSGKPARTSPASAGSLAEFTEVKDRFSGYEVLDERTMPAREPGRRLRTRVVKTAMKYPLVRVEEVIEERGREPAKLIRQTAMVADHVTVKVKADTTEAELSAFAKAHGGTILRKLRTPGPGLYIVKFAEAKVDTVPNAVAALNTAGDAVATVSPDYIVYATETIPNDPMFPKLWGMHNVGQIIGSSGTVASGFDTFTGAPLDHSPATSGVSGILYDCGLGNPGDFPQGVSNNIVLIQRGTISFAAKVSNAMSAGALAVIIYNNQDGEFAGTLGNDGPWIPTLGISQENGWTLQGLAGSLTTVTIDGSTVDADIDGPEAWDLEVGSTNIVVGVIDTGVDYNHPDLAPNIWTNPGEIPGNGIDDDHNGFVDDVHGYDFVNNSADPMDEHLHGTHVAGTIGAVGNNGIGVAGVCWKVRMMALKFLGTNGGTTSDAIESVYYATANGAKLTSNSWGGGGYDQNLLDAIQDASDHDILFVAAAGNSGSNNDVFENFPSNYATSNMVAVAATDSDDNLASFSCYGATTVDIGAPGVNILSTFPTTATQVMQDEGMAPNYGTISGTSMATPHVAGAYALLASKFPGVPMATLRDWLLRQAVPIPSLAGRCVTGGRLNAFGALKLSQEPYVQYEANVASDAAGNADGYLNPGETVGLSVTLRNLGLTPASGIQGNLSCEDTNVTITDASATFPNTQGYGSLTTASNAFSFEIAPTCPTPRQVTFRLGILDGAARAWTNTFTVTFYRSSTINGRVYRTTNGVGIVAATVSYNGPRSGAVQTGSNGTYQINVTDGSYVLVASATNLLISDPRTVVVPPSASGVDFALGVPGLTVSPMGTITVTVEEGGCASNGLTLGNPGDARLIWGLRGKTTPLKNPGTVIRQFTLPNEIVSPTALAYDEGSLWITDWSSDELNRSPAIYRLDPTDGRILSVLDLGGKVGRLMGLYRHGNLLYASEWRDYKVVNSEAILVINPLTGELIRRMPFSPGAPSGGLGIGEGCLWTSDMNDGWDYVDDQRAQWGKRVDPATGRQLGKIPLPMGNAPSYNFGQLEGLSYLNGSLWMVSYWLGSMPNGPFSKADPDTGALIKRFKVNGLSTQLYNLDNDRLRYFWIADARDWLRTVTCFDSGEVAWLRGVPEGDTLSPGHFTNVNLIADAQVLDPGTYTGTVRVVCSELTSLIATQQVNLTVTAAPRYDFVSNWVNDATSPAVGDGDGRPEPGETVALTISIKNNGHAPATGLAGTFTTSGETTVLTGLASFPDAATGATVTALSPFVVQIPTNLLDCVQHFTLELHDSAGRTRSVPVNLSMVKSCRIAGTVTDARTGLPLAGARVEVDATVWFNRLPEMVNYYRPSVFTTVTAADGSYSIDGIPAGNRRVTVFQPLYAGSDAMVAFPPNVVTHNVQLFPPNVTVSPASLTQTLPSGQTATQTVTIANSGALSLAWSVSTGSDGYSVSTSDQPGGPAYNWIEIADTGTALPYGNNAFTPYPLPEQGQFDFGFAMPVFGKFVDGFRFDKNNGYLCFDQADTARVGFCYFSPPIGYSQDPETFSGYKKVSATRMVAEIRHATADNYSFVDAQVLLDPNGRITLQYPRLYQFRTRLLTYLRDFAGNYRYSNLLAEHADSSQLHDQYALQLTPTGDWLAMSPAAGTASSSGSSTVNVVFDATGLAAGTYIMNLQAISADPATPVVNIPVTLTVQGGMPTFDGGVARTSTAWGTAANWAGDTLPTFNNQTDVVFSKNYPVTALDTYIGVNRTVRSITVEQGTAPRINVRPHDGGNTVRVLTFDANTGNPFVVHSGDDLFVLGVGTGDYGSFSLAKTLDVTVNSAAGMTINRPVNGAGGMNKSGTGTLTLGGNVTTVQHSYTGATVINEGTLLINGVKTGAGEVTVGGSAATGTPTLRGTGTIGGGVTIKSAAGGAAGTLAPGTASTAGTLTFSNRNLTIESGARLAFRLGTTNDQVAGVAALTLDGQQWSDFAFTTTASFGPAVYVLVEAVSVSGALGPVVSGPLGGYTGTLIVDGNNDLLLAVSAGSLHTVSYNGNGADSGTAPAAQLKLTNVPLALSGNSGNLQKAGLYFAGWNTAADGAGTDYALGAAYTNNTDLTLYAKWAATLPTCTVTYNANGATSGTSPATQTKTNDLPLTLAGNSGNLAKTGYSFTGWNTAADGSGTSYAEGATYTNNVSLTLYAKWVATYTVSYDANGATSGTAPATQTKTNGVPLTLAGNTGSLAKTGYSFYGWNTATNGTGTSYTAGGTYTNDAVVVLYAKWTASVGNTWDGGATFGGWLQAGNWDNDTVPTFGNTTVLTFSIPTWTGVRSSTSIELDRTVKGITLGQGWATAGSGTFYIKPIAADNSTARVLTFSANAGNAFINVTAAADGAVRPIVFGGSTNNVPNGTFTLTSSLDVASDSTVNPITINRPLTSAGGINKFGSGTLILGMIGTTATGGTNHTYSGGTTVNGGALLINANKTGSGAIIVGGTSATGTPTLGGTGTVSGAVTIASAGGGAAGTLSPGGISTAGTLTLNNAALTLQSGAKLNYRLGTTSDTVAGVTTLALNGQVWSDFTFTTNAGFGPGTYTLIAATSVTGALGATVSGSVGGYPGTLRVNGSNDLVLTVSSSGSTPGPLTSVVAAGGNVSFTASGSGLLIVQVSTNLVDWVSLLTNTAPFSFTDTNAVNTYPRRFYRTKTP